MGESPWLSQLDDVSVGHGVSLLWWRSGGVEHPHDTPPYPFMPSPTSAHSSAPQAPGERGALFGSIKVVMKIAQIAPLIESVPPRLYGGTERIVSY
ncbi:MAG: hypothetical protein WCF50_30640, partial [Pseudolabrys sp.]